MTDRHAPGKPIPAHPDPSASAKERPDIQGTGLGLPLPASPGMPIANGPVGRFLSPLRGASKFGAEEKEGRDQHAPRLLVRHTENRAKTQRTFAGPPDTALSAATRGWPPASLTHRGGPGLGRNAAHDRDRTTPTGVSQATLSPAQTKGIPSLRRHHEDSPDFISTEGRTETPNTFVPPTDRSERRYLGVLGFMCVLLLAREALAAPIRAYIPQIWYVPDGLLIASLGYIVFHQMKKGKSGLLVWIALIVTWCLLSLITLKPASIVHVVRYHLMLVAGFAAGQAATFERQPIWRAALAILVIVCVAGVIYDARIGFKWPTSEFTGAFRTDAVAKVWSISGARRIGGLGIGSPNTAMFLGCAFLALWPEKRLRYSTTLKFLIITSALMCFEETRQRAYGFWFFFSLGLIALATLHDGLKSVLAANLTKICTIVSLGGGMLAPFVFYRVDIAALFGKTAMSLWERSFIYWPKAIDRFLSMPTFLFGDGIGSISIAGSFTNRFMAYHAENFFLTLGITMGLGAFAFIIYTISTVMKANFTIYRVLTYAVILNFVFFCGITDTVAYATPALILGGYALGFLFERRKNRIGKP